jgi:hypothetical protein
MKKVGKFQVVDHGSQNSSYFQGHGVSYTDYDETFTGAGSSPQEALDDALEQAYSEWEFTQEQIKEIEKEMYQEQDMFVGISLTIHLTLEGDKAVGVDILDASSTMFDLPNMSFERDEKDIRFYYDGGSADDAVLTLEKECDEQGIDCTSIISKLERKAQEIDNNNEHYYYVSVDLAEAKEDEVEASVRDLKPSSGSTRVSIRLVAEEEDFGDSELWVDALFEDFDFWSAFEAGHIYSKKDRQGLIDRLKKEVKTEKDLDKVFWGFGGFKDASGVPTVSESASDHEAALKKHLKDEVYFSDFYPSADDHAAHGFFPFDAKILEENLNKLTGGSVTASKQKNPEPKAYRITLDIVTPSKFTQHDLSQIQSPGPIPYLGDIEIESDVFDSFVSKCTTKEIALKPSHVSFLEVTAKAKSATASLNKSQMIKALKKVEDKANSGHYLSRLIAIVDAVKMKDEADLLRAHDKYMNQNAKPSGLDALMYDVSTSVLSLADQLGLSDEDLKPAVWGLDYDALKDYSRAHLRSQG